VSAPGRAPIRPGNIPGGSGRSGKDSRRSRGERDGFPTTHYANWNGVQVVAGSNPVAPTISSRFEKGVVDAFRSPFFVERHGRTRKAWRKRTSCHEPPRRLCET